ncbi:hypothetical protein BH09BAC1_BH09BAC1_27350 [soil metagenome]
MWLGRWCIKVSCIFLFLFGTTFAYIHTMNLYQYSGIARPVDFNYPTNKLIAVLSALALLAGIGMGWWQGLVFGKVILLGLHFALTVFLTWAFAREVDPHEPYSAFGAVVFAAAGFVWGIRPELLGVAVFMGAARMLICSCGRPVTIIDRIMITGGAAWLAFGANQPLGVAVIAVVFLLDGLMKPAHRWSLLFAAIAMGMAVTAFYLNPPIPNISTGLLDGKVLILALFSLYTFMAYRRPEAPADSNDTTISRKRLRALHIMLLVWVIMALPIHGQAAINKLFIVWSVMAGVSIYAVALGVFRRKAGNV